MPSESDSVSQWFERVRRRDETAAQRLWGWLGSKLVRAARRHVPHTMRRVADEEDLALRAFNSLLVRARRGEFSGIESREQLWALLLVILQRQADTQIRDELRQRRGAGRVRGESALHTQAHSPRDDVHGLQAVAAVTESPSAAIVREEWFSELLSVLDDTELSRILCYKCDGYSNREIARRIRRSVATVERRLQLIRIKLEEAEAPS